MTLTHPWKVLSFMDRHPDSDLNTFEAALRHLSRFSQRGGHRTNAQIVEDASFHALLSGLTSRLEECDATLLSKISDSSGRRVTEPSRAGQGSEDLAFCYFP